MRIAFVSPRTAETYTGQELAARMLFKRYATPPLGLLTVAGLTPSRFEVELFDENTGEIDWDTDADVVALGVLHHQRPRAIEIARRFRSLGKLVVMGGPSVTAVPEAYRDHADVLVRGEAEGSWPGFLADLEKGTHEQEYHTQEPVDLSLATVPRFDLVAPRHYMNMSVQATRGCPFRCEFCDVISLFGRKVRMKPVPQVLAEIERLLELGARRIYLVDDNLIGLRRYTRDLLGAIRDQFAHRSDAPTFSCQVTIDLSQDSQLMVLFREAGVRSAFIGIETPRVDSLREAHKDFNARTDLVRDVETIQSHGIAVYSGLVVGFDHDDDEVFDEQVAFLESARIPICTPTQLTALPETQLYDRLASEGRLKQASGELFEVAYSTSNIVPKQMSSAELDRGFRRMVSRIYAPDAFAGRLLGELERLNRAPWPRPGIARLAVNVLGMVWVLGWFLLDPERSALLRAYFRVFTRALFRYPRLVQLAVVRLILYRHLYRYTAALDRPPSGAVPPDHHGAPAVAPAAARPG